MKFTKAAMSSSPSRGKATRLSFLKKTLVAVDGVEMSAKSGAMFGLDARIALAIFGALSVISGAALYSAIQDAKTTALLADINEIGKAWEQYMLDTGQDLPKNTTETKHRIVTDLIINNTTNWKGPYLNNKQSEVVFWGLLHKNGYDIYLPSVSNQEWGLEHSTNTRWSLVPCNDSTIQCYTSINLTSYTAGNDIIKQAQNLDKKVDNGNGAYKGKVRWQDAFGAQTLAYIYAPHKMPQ